ncbi:MAG: heterodisulfide reductase-related iron-sulfur binding cluster [Desulfobacterales bacterium]|jgi:Fe-S oxidoreductase/nitrate reductase gamma subunit|nr:heterodisulfide reductase-related iron-sulfur binding cluster [Desulfobacterales bacterium]
MGRIPYWNISYGLLIDAFALPAVALLVYGLYAHWKKIQHGKERVKPNLPPLPGKIGPVYIHALITKGILGSKIYRKIFTGIAHGFVFWGMVFLAIGTGLVMLNIYLKVPVFEGGFNRWFMSFFLDLAGLVALGGLIFLFMRRLFGPERLRQPKERLGFVPQICLLGFVIASGFYIEALRIAANGPDPYSFVGNFLAGFFPMGNNGLHRVLWWTHGLMAMAFIAYIPFSPMVHIALAPTNAALANPKPGTRMGVIDFSSFDDETAEEVPTLGCAKLTDFTRKRLLDYDSCLWCGRCHEVCPAASTGKSLSPKGVMVTLAEKLHSGGFDDEGLIDEVGMDAIFACTTCTACMEACPVCINQPKTILKFRQNLVMEQSRIPELMGKANNSLEQRQHPFFGTGSGPKDWCKGLDVPIFEKGETEYLLWIGCAPTYEERSQKIAQAMVEILQKANISFGILEESRCTGDPAKQMGNEFLFREIALQNVEEFSELGVKDIITLCPHCYNSFSRHYPPLGGEYNVIPHSVFLNELLEKGKIKIDKKNQSICYHDPCYLGRRNGFYDAPRAVLGKAGNCIEMQRHKNNSFCCGGGGGNYWAEEEGTRINRNRAKEAFETSADIVATACPFCLAMLTDGMKSVTDEQKVFDIAEIINVAMS